MGLGIRFGEDLLVLPILSPVDNTSDIYTSYVSVSKAHRVTFGLQFGNITTSSIAIYVEESSAADTTSAAEINFRYRISDKTGGDTWSAVSTASTAGILIDCSADDNRMLLIDVDPSSMSDGKTFLTVRINASGSSPGLVSAFVVLQPRYAQLNIAVTT